MASTPIRWATGLALLTAVAAGCSAHHPTGGAPSPTPAPVTHSATAPKPPATPPATHRTTAPPAPAPTTARRTTAPPAPSKPPGDNGGDHDADNNGGPDDGDGNI